MVEWLAPKTDWNGYTDGKGDYHGDRFNMEDYNRIKNNIQFLRNFAVNIYIDFDIVDMGPDKSEDEYPYADEINLIENNLEIVAKNTYSPDIGESQIFMDNTAFIDFCELNRIEGATLDIYNKLSSQYEGRRMFVFMLGQREVF